MMSQSKSLYTASGPPPHRIIPIPIPSPAKLPQKGFRRQRASLTWSTFNTDQIPKAEREMLVSLTVGKVDAGVAVLLTEDKRLIEFPSLLLPPSITPGSIVDITVSLNQPAHQKAQASFRTLQSSILSTYGLHSPSPPILTCLNSTQTSVVLSFDELNLATAELRSLTLYRNGQRAGIIPREKALAKGGGTTKISGLAVDSEHTFSLALKTSAGQYHSERLLTRTHKMTDLSGIVITPGILPPQLLSSLENAVDRIGARITEAVGIETTHFVTVEGRGKEWEKAQESNVPVVRPEWVEGCEREGRLVGVRGYYLGADPRQRQVGSGIVGQGNVGAPTSAAARQSQQSLPAGGTPQQQQQQQQQHQSRQEQQSGARPQGDSSASSSQQQFKQRPNNLADRTKTGDRDSMQPNPLSSNPPTDLKSPGSEIGKPAPPAKDSPFVKERGDEDRGRRRRQQQTSHEEEEEEGDEEEEEGDGEYSEEYDDDDEADPSAPSSTSQQRNRRPRDLGISNADSFRGGGGDGGGGDGGSSKPANPYPKEEEDDEEDDGGLEENEGAAAAAVGREKNSSPSERRIDRASSFQEVEL